MEIVELGSLGELLSSIAMLITLIFLLIEMKRSNTLQRRENVKQSSRDNSNALKALLAEDVSEIFMRGNNEGVTALTPHERYRYDIAYYLWLQTIEFAHADHRAGYFIEENLNQMGISVQGFLSSPGGGVWWRERQYWFNKSFRNYVDEILAADIPEAVFAGQSPRSAGVE